MTDVSPGLAAKLAAAAERNHQASVATLRKWADALEANALPLTPAIVLPTPEDVVLAVSAFFDRIERDLADQRAVVKVLAEAGTHVAGILTQRSNTAASEELVTEAADLEASAPPEPAATATAPTATVTPPAPKPKRTPRPSKS